MCDRRRPCGGSMLGRRRRRRPNIEPPQGVTPAVITVTHDVHMHDYTHVVLP